MTHALKFKQTHGVRKRKRKRKQTDLFCNLVEKFFSAWRRIQLLGLSFLQKLTFCSEAERRGWRSGPDPVRG